MKLLFSSLICLALVIVGCGGSQSKTVTQDISYGDLKEKLQMLAETGVPSGYMSGVKEEIQKLPADKIEPMLKDYAEIMRSGTKPDKVKEIAKRMVERL